MLPSASRYSTWETNAQTFFATNMMPQNGSFNSGSWATLEGKVRSWGGLQKYDTLYVVTGTYFSNSYKTMSNTNVGGSIRVAVPDKCWKVLLRQRGNQNKSVSELPASELKAIAFVFDQRLVEREYRVEGCCLLGEGDRNADGLHVFPQPRSGRR